MFQTKVVEKIKTHILCPVIFFKVVPFMRKFGKNSVERGRTRTTVQRVRIACWIRKATNTHTPVV
jgi:hypothetical protein